MTNHLPLATETSPAAHRLARTIFRPLERFLHIEASSGILLLLAAAVALVWANSGAGGSYDHLWHTPVRVGVGGWMVERSLHYLINDALMTVFFFVVGLEIRREMHEGELADLRRATLPAAAAIGGMLAPALIFVALGTAESRRGFGVPMATDIAFAVGVLALLGKRVPPALRVLLLSLAIIDDIGAILVIAAFYSKGIAWSGLGIAAAGIAAVIAFQRFGVRKPWAYVAPGAVVWVGIALAGVHPTIAGVILGLLTPARPWFGEQGFLSATQTAIDDFRRTAEQPGHDTHDLLDPLARVKEARSEALSPAVRLQTALHPWVAFGIMPLFALANAGVSVKGVSIEQGTPRTIALGALAGLVVGKPLGIVLASFLCVKLGVCRLPRGVRWSGVLVVGVVAGIGFTMAIFIAGLAFTGPDLAAAKLGVLAASGVAALIGLVLGRVVLPAPSPEEAATTLAQAEASAEL